MSLSSVRVIRRVTGWGWPHFPLEARPNLVRSLRLCVDGAERRLAVSLVPALLPNDTLTHQQTQMAGDPFPGFFLFGYRRKSPIHTTPQIHPSTAAVSHFPVFLGAVECSQQKAPVVSSRGSSCVEPSLGRSRFR